MSRHRKPPVPHWKKGAGFCRWCGEAVLNHKGEASKGRWHPACVSAYKLAAWSAEQRRVCWERDQGVCGVCGIDTAATSRDSMPTETWRIYHSTLGYRNTGHLWQADHIRPLVDGGGLDLEYFAKENLRTTCTACHKAKTKREAGERAARRRPAVVVLPEPDLFGCSK